MTYRHTRIASFLGMATQAISINLPALLFVVFHERHGVSLSALGALVAATFFVQILVDAFCARFVDRIGYRAAALGAAGFSAAGLLLLPWLPRLTPTPFPGIAAALLTAALGSGLLEVIVSPIVEAIPSDRKAADMSALHAAYCWGHVATILGSTAYFLLFGLDAWRWLPIAWAAVPLATFALYARCPIRTLTSEAEPPLPLGRLLTSRLFLLFLAMMICGGAAEQAMSQWASLFAQLGTGVSKTLGDLLGPLLFAVLMGSARTYFGVRGSALDVGRAIRLSCALGVAGYLLASLGRAPLACLAGCALCGLAAGVLWPGTLSLASASFPRGGTALFGLLALGGDVGCALGPAFVGTLSDLLRRLCEAAPAAHRAAEGLTGETEPLALGLKLALLLAALFPAAMWTCSQIRGRETDKLS